MHTANRSRSATGQPTHRGVSEKQKVDHSTQALFIRQALPQSRCHVVCDLTAWMLVKHFPRKSRSGLNVHNDLWQSAPRCFAPNIFCMLPADMEVEGQTIMYTYICIQPIPHDDGDCIKSTTGGPLHDLKSSGTVVGGL